MDGSTSPQVKPEIPPQERRGGLYGQGMYSAVAMACGLAGAASGTVAVFAPATGDDEVVYNRVGYVAASGLAGAVVGARLGAVVVLPAFWATAVAGVGLVTADVRRHRLPYRLVVPLYGVALACFGLDAVVRGDAGRLARAVVGCVATLVVFLVMALVAAGGFGLGDVVLLGALALSLAWLGWRSLIVGVLGGLVIGAIAGMVLTVRWRLTRREWPSLDAMVFPLGPALLAAWLIATLLT
jgi:type IV leader peptidase family protein